MTTRGLVKKFTALGMPCEIDAGPTGIVIYANSCERTARIATEILSVAKSRDASARIDAPVRFDPDEPDSTAWWVSITLDWKKF